MSKTNMLGYKQLPKTYEALCHLHLPRPIHDKVALENATELVDLMAGHNLNEEQEDYLDLISDLVADYEETQDPFKTRKLSDLEALRYVLDQSGTSASALSTILDVDRSLGSKILRGERRLTADHISKLAKHFSVSPELFLN